MSTIIHILNRNLSDETIESSVINASEIAELKCTHPKKEEKIEGEEDKGDLAKFSEIEIIYKSGEIKNITTEMPTVFRIFRKGVVTPGFESQDARKFDEAYLDAIVKENSD
jgi:hypothetical protein